MTESYGGKIQETQIGRYKSTRGINYDSVPWKLWEKSKKLFWDPADLDFSQDAVDWQEMSETARTIVAMSARGFMVGEEAVTMDHVLMPLGDFDRNDVSGDAGGEGDLAGCSVRPILGHEERAATSDALEGSQETTASGVLGVGGHLDGLAHPGEFAGLGDDCVIVVEEEFEDGHGSTYDAMLHGFSCSLL